jgi:transcriptional regulator with XRE-family HTH domain
MSISAITELSKPGGDSKISAGTFAYINTRTLLRAYTLVSKELKESGITQAQLARRLGKAPEVVSRMLSRPRNWELKTFSELLFAISGAVLTFSISRPLERRDENRIHFYKVSLGGGELRGIEQVSIAPIESKHTLARISNVHIRRPGIALNSLESTAAAQ